MNRLTKKLKELKAENKKALVAYLVAGDPDIESTLSLMKLFIESGVDIIEIGVPFTDPIAEGPIIQKAHDRALQKNVSLSLIFNMIKDFRIEDNETPIVLMGYLNTFISHKDLIKNNEENSIDSILVVDIPGEVNLADYGLESSNVNTISLISPTTKENRINHSEYEYVIEKIFTRMHTLYNKISENLKSICTDKVNSCISKNMHKHEKKGILNSNKKTFDDYLNYMSKMNEELITNMLIDNGIIAAESLPKLDV